MSDGASTPHQLDGTSPLIEGREDQPSLIGLGQEAGGWIVDRAMEEGGNLAAFSMRTLIEAINKSRGTDARAALDALRFGGPQRRGFDPNT